MRFLLTLAVAVLLGCCGIADAQICRGSKFQCKYCGSSGSSPYQCYAYKSNFDDRKTGNIRDYNHARFKKFAVYSPADADPKPPHVAKSPPNIAVAGPALGPRQAEPSISFPGSKDGRYYNFGNLNNLYFGCTSIQRLGAIACDLNIQAGCVDITNPDKPKTAYYDATFHSDPGRKFNGELAFADWDAVREAYTPPKGKQVLSNFCFNYTFITDSAEGPAALEVDSMIYSAFYNPFN